MKDLHGETVTRIEDEHEITRREIIHEIRKRLPGPGHDMSGQEQGTPQQQDPCFSVPFIRNRQFVNRGQLDEVERRLFIEGNCPKIAIYGLGGVGKTQIALELAYRTREQRPDYSVFWVPATTVENFQQAYLDIGRKLHLLQPKEQKEDIKKIVQDYLSQESSGHWLLIYDNADDIDMWVENTNATNEPTLINYIPRSNKGSIIFTTRNRKAAVKLAHQNVVGIREMDEDAAIQMLSRLLIDQQILNDRHIILDLLEQLTFLPLAIAQAAAYMNENGITVSEYLLLLRDKEQNIVEVLSENFEDEGRYRHVQNPVATTWLISFDQIRCRDPLAAEYLSFMACLNPKAIPQSLLPPAPSKKRMTDAIGTLSGYSFITRRPADESLDLHRLVHLATRNWLRMENCDTEWVAKAIARLDCVFPSHDHKNRDLWRAYLPHAQYLVGSDLGNGVRERLSLLMKLGQCLLSDGRYNDAEKPFLEVMEANKMVLGEEHPATLTSMANLASTYCNQGRWKEAEELEKYVMKARTRMLGEEHPDTLTSMANLASTYCNQGQWKEAEELEKYVIEIRKRVLGEKHPDTLTSMANLASIYRNQGQWKEAEKLEKYIMKASKRVLGEEHPDTLTSMANLASTYWNQGRWKEAEELGKYVMEARERVLGEEHPATLTSMANLASTYWNQGRWKEAEKLEKYVIETRQRVLGEEHPDTLISMANLASTYCNQGQWKEAEELEKYVMKTRERVLGEEHPDTLISMANLASTYWNQGQWKKAEELTKYVIEVSKRVLGEEHPATLTSMINLASTYWNQGQWKEAEELEKYVIETSKRVLGEEHPATLTSMANLALTYQNQGQWKEAEELGKYVMKTRERVLGEEHPDTLTSMANLAFTWKSLEHNKDAIGLMEKCFRLQKVRLGSNHPDTVSSLHTLDEWRVAGLAIDD